VVAVDDGDGGCDTPPELERWWSMGRQGRLRHILEKLRLLGVVVVEGSGGSDIHAARAGQGGPVAGEHMRKKNN
jgi:hypothetical protein